MSGAWEQAWPCVRPTPCPRSLTKDMTGKEDSYRGPAVRALCQITDVSAPLWGGVRDPGAHACSPPHCSTPAPPQSTMLQAIERYMKQAIVDKVPSVSSSALVSSLVCSLGRDSGWGRGWGWSGD